MPLYPQQLICGVRIYDVHDVQSMKRLKVIFLFLILPALSDLNLAQESTNDSLLAHYPIQVGNVWDYSGARSFGSITSFPLLRLVTAIKDSVHNNGKRYVVLNQVTYDMGLRQEANFLGGIHQEIRLRRVDSTSLNVYEVVPLDRLLYGDELLVDSLFAKPGDTIISNSELEIMLNSIHPEIFLGQSRVQRELFALEYGLISSHFITTEELGQTSWSGGEGEITSWTLQAAIINGDTTGTLLRDQEPALLASEQELVFSENVKNRRIVFSNDGKGLTIIDSVKVENDSLFYSKPSHQGGDFVFPETFSKGPFLVFPADSIFLDIFVREEGLEQVFEDTLSIYASGLSGQILTPIHLPIRIEAVVSVESDASNGRDLLPESFNLQAYPNPLYGRQNLKIVYQLNKPENVYIKVYDILGRHVTTLARQRIPRGKHNVEWDSHGIPSGVYFISVTTENRREAIRLQILK